MVNALYENIPQGLRPLLHLAFAALAPFPTARPQTYLAVLVLKGCTRFDGGRLVIAEVTTAATHLNVTTHVRRASHACRLW